MKSRNFSYSSCICFYYTVQVVISLYFEVLTWTSLPPLLERCGLFAAVAGSICGVLWKAHRCELAWASAVRSSNFVPSCIIVPSTSLQNRMNFGLFGQIAFWCVYFTLKHCLSRLEECTSEVPLLPSEVLVFLSTQLWQSAPHLSDSHDHSSNTPHPLLLIKFFIIVCRLVYYSMMGLSYQ